MEYIISSLRIVVIIDMTDVGVVEERLSQLLQLEEEHFVADYHQNVEKERHKVWHDQHIKSNKLQVSGIVLLYDSKFLKHPGKIKTHWMGPYVVFQVTKGGVIQLEKLGGTPFKGLVNGSRLKPYLDSCDLVS